MDAPAAVGIGPSITVVVGATFAVVRGGANEVHTVVLGVDEAVFVGVAVRLVNGRCQRVVKAVVAPRIAAFHLEADLTCGGEGGGQNRRWVSIINV